MFGSEKKGFFDAFNPKTTFIMGLIASILLICAIGFFILLAKEMNSKDGSNANGENNYPAVADNSDQPAQPSAKVDIKLSGTYHILGSKSASVKIVEFSDFQCPYCKSFQSSVNQALEEYGNKVALIFKHFPLDQLHANARPAAEAAECVADQKGDDAFFKFIDQLFSNQANLGSELYEKLAKDLGLNLNKFNDCVSSGKYKDKVNADYQEGLSYEVNGTPASFINGTRVPGAVPYATLKSYIEAVLK